jgi:hypothetical protein
MQMKVDNDELKKIEEKHGALKRVKKDKVKWLVPPNWTEKTFEASVVEAPENEALEIFEKFKVKAIRKK